MGQRCLDSNASQPLQNNAMQASLCNTIQCQPLQYNTSLCNKIQCKPAFAIQCNTMQCLDNNAMPAFAILCFAAHRSDIIAMYDAMDAYYDIQSNALVHSLDIQAHLLLYKSPLSHQSACSSLHYTNALCQATALPTIHLLPRGT